MAFSIHIYTQLGDRITDETDEWEVASRAHTTAGGKTVHVRVSE